MPKGCLGSRIMGSDFQFDLYIRRGAGAYICGEEGSLLNSLEGKHPFPRNRPPFPVTHGFEDLPTVVNNVETLAAAAQIMRHPPEWYVGLGRNGHAGTKLISLSGDIQRPGNYEVPFGLPLRTLLYDWAGGPLADRAIQAVTMAGISGGFLAGDDLDSATIDEPSMRSKGSMLGAAGMIVFDDRRDMIQAAHNAMEFFAHEVVREVLPLPDRHAAPGRAAGRRWAERSDALAGRSERSESTMKAVSACGLGMAAPLVVESLIQRFPAQVAAHVEHPKDTMM